MPAAPSLEEASTVKQETSHTYSANFVDQWCIGSVPHGGYVTTTFMRVASLHFGTTLNKQNQPHTIALHLDFLRRTEAGPALFTVKDVKLGRQTSVIHVTLSQSIGGNNREEVVGYITQSNMNTESGATFERTWRLDPLPPMVDLSKLDKDQDMNWALHHNTPFSEFRKASIRSDWHMPRKGQPSTRIGDVWFRLNTRSINGQRERFTNEKLGYVADMWPQLVEQHVVPDVYLPSKVWAEDSKKGTAKFWFPTLLLNIDFKKSLPMEGVEWLFVRVSTKQIKNGRYDIDVTILDDKEDIVALSHHVAFALPAARNLAKRSKGTKEKL